jgi:RNA polymerase sigma-70 factor (ECF subfamily)
MKSVANIPMIHGAVLPEQNEPKPSLGNDEALARRLRTHDKAALADLLEQYSTMMYSVAMRFMRNEDAAREVVQDALIAVWNKAGTYRGQAKLGTWLYRVTANAALMQLRKQRRRQPLVSLDDPGNPDFVMQDDHGEGPDAGLLLSELGEHIQRAIDALPEPHRTTVILADSEGLSLAAIAELTHSSAPTAKTRLHRARLILRKKLSRYLEPQPQLTVPMF